MTRFVVSILSFAMAFVAVADGITSHIQASGNITIVQPSALDSLLVRPEVSAQTNEETAEDIGSSVAPSTRSGYRVQVFDDNNPRTARAEAEKRRSQVISLYPDMSVYVTFDSPYWRVKVGDFRTRAEAEATMADLKHAFPAMAAYMRIVRDKIVIND